MIAVPFVLNAIFNFAIGLLIAKCLGTAEYGYYAVAFSIAIVIGTFAFEWLRLSAIRFYSERDRESRPEIRATLNVLFGLFAFGAILFAGGIAFSGINWPLPAHLLSLAIALAVANGIFDFSTALLRARFLDRAYGILVISRNVLSIALAVGGAWYFHSATAALAGLILSIGGSIAMRGRVLKDRGAAPRLARRGIALRYATYAVPIVLSNILYQIVPLMNRGILADVHNYAQAGTFALPFDIGTRIFAAIGSALDVILFQLAVHLEKTHGIGAARGQISRNMGIVFAVILPAVAGCWLILPSFVHLLVPADFRETFGRYFTLMLPAMLCFAVTNYCVGQAFLLAHRTTPLIIGGLVAFLANGLALVFLPASHDATTFALAQSISSCAGLAALLAFLFTLEPMWPRARDIGGAIAATIAMIAAVLPLRAMTPGIVTLLLQVGVGTCVYTLGAILLDVGALRSRVVSAFKPWLGLRLPAGARAANPARVSDEACCERDRRLPRDCP